MSRVRHALLAALLAALALPARASAPDRAAVERVVADYVGLYTASTVDRWQGLFDPGLVVALPGEDGRVATRGLAEFVEKQRAWFASGHAISERLENVRIDVGRRIARVSADFIVAEDGVESRGKLGLHLVQGRDGWKIVAVLFSYDEE